MEHPFVSYTAEIPEMEPFDQGELGRTYQFVEPLKQRGLGGIVLGFYGKPNKPKQLTIKVGIEMAPFFNNRIRINPGMVDPFGNPGADLQLNFSDMDQQLLIAGEEIVYDIFSQLHSAEIHKHEELHWSHHHLGTTRMSKSPADGVVDPNLRVHGTENLYVISSSVFVTSGVANSTLTITALAHRLSEHLTSVL
jgi:choline dehydrogenase-like flavoprotein